MRTEMMHGMAAFAAAVFTGPLAAEILTIEPAAPKWGDTITVTYDTAAEGATILPTEDVRIVAFVYERDDGSQRPYPVRREGEKLIASVSVEEGFSYLTFYAATPRGANPRHSAQVMIRTPNGTPAPGACVQAMFNEGPDGWREQFEREIELYPNSIYAYRQKWFIAGAYDKDGLNAMIEADLAALESKRDIAPAEWLYVQVFAKMTLGDEPAAREAVLTLLDEYGTSTLTKRAVSDYQYQCFSRGIKGDGPEAVEAAVCACAERFPAGALARDKLVSLANDEAVALETIEAIAAAWLEDVPEHPLPHYSLVAAHLKHESDGDPTQAIRHARLAIDGMLAGQLTWLDSVSGFTTKRYLPSTYRILGKAALRAGRYGEALGAAEAAIAVADEADARNQVLLAEIWNAIGDFDRASAAYAGAHLTGDTEAEAKLRALYATRHESEKGFDAYFANLTKRAGSDEERPEAPAFTATSLADTAFNLESLRGKVVVLNFWFIGCAPCRVEMPGLNDLVAEYEGRDDVVFIAFALDDAEALRKFLAEKPFDYEIIPAGGEIARTYEVSAYPTHVIIDKTGRVAARLTGGSETRHDDLRPLIDLALDE